MSKHKQNQKKWGKYYMIFLFKFLILANGQWIRTSKLVTYLFLMHVLNVYYCLPNLPNLTFRKQTKRQRTVYKTQNWKEWLNISNRTTDHRFFGIVAGPVPHVAHVVFPRVNTNPGIKSIDSLFNIAYCRRPVVVNYTLVFCE